MTKLFVKFKFIRGKYKKAITYYTILVWRCTTLLRNGLIWHVEWNKI